MLSICNKQHLCVCVAISIRVVHYKSVVRSSSKHHYGPLVKYQSLFYY